MEMFLIIGLFVVNAMALHFLISNSLKLSGAMNVVGLCLTVAIAYQFDQMENIMSFLVCIVVIVVVSFLARAYFKYKKKTKQKKVEVK